MHKLFAALMGLLVLPGAALAADDVAFGGDRLVRKHQSLGARGGLVEFVPADETLQSWTRLVGYRAMLDSAQNPAQAAAAVARLAEQRYPGAKPRVLVKGSEAMVDFVLAAPGGLVEFNVFRYAPGPGGRGVVSLQYARRFRDLGPDDVRALCARYVNEAARGSMEEVRQAFAASGGPRT